MNMILSGVRFSIEIMVVVVVHGHYGLVALYCNGLASNSWYVLVR